ncbi:MAG: hypothetical protein IBX50_08795 [Marinospirillum sp.]|uniref:hypothetical protein n=1 Tax=Marinospirillum sp. TaxID=2183934 RepID=UPI0019DEBBC6|nr:hypothetical protein [Marinospirillum sp.]MBE0506802.1 hypothetical protein [Marinospirillum sp.]
MTADTSVAASERQAVLGISVLGLETHRLSFPVVYCGLKQVCVPIGSWSVRLDQSTADALLADNLAFLIPSRYDQMVFEGQTARFSTATQVFTDLPLSNNIPPIASDPTSFSDYQQRLQTYLNTHITPQMQQILATAAEARYLEMNAQERGTFLREQARATGMPAVVLEGLISSSYAFGFYLPRMQGGITIRQVERTRYDGSKYIVYSTSINAPARTRMLVYQYNGKEFQPLLNLNTNTSLGLDALAQSASSSASVETLFLPSSRNAQNIFDQAFATSFRDSAIALSTQLKEYRAFAVVTPVLGSRASAIELAVGNQENIRVDQPFTFNRIINSRERQVGWGQVYQTGNSCLALPPEQRSLSYARLIKGRVDEADLAVEHPWTGVFATLGLTDSQLGLELQGQETGAGGAQFLELGFSGNLGYLRNNPSLSGWWLNMGLGFGAADDPTESTFSHLQAEGAVRFYLGMEKHWALSHGFYSALGGGFSVESYTFEDRTMDEQLSVSSFNLIPSAELGYHFTPNSRIFLKAAYNQPLTTRAEYKDTGEIDGDLLGGAALTLGFAMHLGFAGPYAWLIKKPSQQCNQLRDTISHQSF